MSEELQEDSSGDEYVPAEEEVCFIDICMQGDPKICLDTTIFFVFEMNE